jgi:hypothetical protein
MRPSFKSPFGVHSGNLWPTKRQDQSIVRRNIMSFRAFVTLLCGCLIVLAAATSTATAQQCNYNAKTNTCGGTCPPGTVCLKIAGSNACKCQQMIDYSCQYNPEKKTCGGTCPKGQLCTMISGSACDCRPINTCQYNPEKKTCGGPCPKGQACIKDPLGICSCH